MALQVTLLSAVLSALCVSVCAHVALTYPPARRFDLDFLDNSRTKPPCGMPKGTLRTSFLAGSTFTVHWHLAYAHRGGFSLRILDELERPVLDLTPRAGGSEFVRDDVTAQKFEVRLPSDFTCDNCTLQLQREAGEWGEQYRFWSCADIDIVPRKDYHETCSGHGFHILGRCKCSKMYSGSRCQFSDECSEDNDCGLRGKCVDINATESPSKMCYCPYGFYGKGCNKKAPWKDKNIDLSRFSRKELSPAFALYWRILRDEGEAEFVMIVNGTTWAGLGWRPAGITKQCKNFPVLGPALDSKQSTPKPEPLPEPEPKAEPGSKPEPKSEPAPEPTAEPKAEPEPTAEPKAEPEPTAEPKAEPEPSSEPNPSPEPKSEPQPEPKAEPKAEGSERVPKSEPAPEPTAEPKAEPSPEPEPTTQAAMEIDRNKRVAMHTVDGFDFKNLGDDVTVKTSVSYKVSSSKGRKKRASPEAQNVETSTSIVQEPIPEPTQEPTPEPSSEPEPVTTPKPRPKSKFQPKPKSLPKHKQFSQTSITPEPKSTPEPTPEPKSEPEPTPEPKSEPEPSPEPKSEPEPSPEPKSEPEPSPEPKSEPEPSREPKSEPEPSPEPKSEPEPSSEPYSEPEPSAEPKSEPEPSAEPKSEPEPSPEPKSEPEPFPEPKSEPEPSAEPKSKPELFPEPKSEPQPSPEPKSEPEPSPEPKSDPEPKSEPEPSPEPKSEPEPSPEPKSEPEPTIEPKAEHDQATLLVKGLKEDTGYYPSHEYVPKFDFNPMDCTDLVIGTARGNYHRVQDYYTRDRSTPRVDSFWGGHDDITAASGFEENGVTTILFRKKLQAKEPTDHSLVDDVMHVIWARGQEPNHYVHSPPSGIERGAAATPNFYRQDELKYHGHRDQRGVSSINFFEEAKTAAAGGIIPLPDKCGGMFKIPADCDVTNNTCDYTASWEYLGQKRGKDSVRFTIRTKQTKHWTGIGFSNDKKMSQTDAIIGWVDPRSGRPFLMDTWVSGYSAPRVDPRQDLRADSGASVDGVTELSFVRKRDTGDDKDLAFTDSACLYMMFIPHGGPFDPVNKRTSKHLLTPIVSDKRVCIKPCGPEPAEDATTAAPADQVSFRTLLRVTGLPPSYRAPAPGADAFRHVEDELRRGLRLPGVRDVVLEGLMQNETNAMIAEITLKTIDSNLIPGSARSLSAPATASAAADAAAAAGEEGAGRWERAIRQAVADGKLANLQVDPDFVVVQPLGLLSSAPEPESEDAPFFGLAETKLYVVVACVAALILVALLQAGCTMYRARGRGGNKEQLIPNAAWKDYAPNTNYAFEPLDEQLSMSMSSQHQPRPGRPTGPPPPRPASRAHPPAAHGGHNGHNGHSGHNGHNGHSGHNGHHGNGNGNSAARYYRDTRSLQRHQANPPAYSTTGRERSTYSLPRGVRAEPPSLTPQPDFYFMPSQRKYEDF